MESPAAWPCLVGRFLVVFLPVFLAMVAAIAWGAGKGAEVPWALFIYYAGLLMALAWCFLGLAMLLSTLTRSADVAQASAFVLWLTLLLFLDLILLGVMIRGHLPPETAVAIALINPLQVFRTAAMLLLDQQLVMLGPSAYVILDAFGQAGYIAFALLYPTLLGTLSAWLGYVLFKRSDLP